VKKNLSPYDLASGNDSPMRLLLTELIDFDRLRLQQDIQLTVSATNARTARRRSSPIKTSRSMLYWLRPACRNSLAPWRLMASHIGTALSPETRPSVRYSLKGRTVI
jgi:hypothetical protein